MAEYIISDKDNLEKIWDMNVSSNPGDERWVRWKDEYISYNIEFIGMLTSDTILE